MMAWDILFGVLAVAMIFYACWIFAGKPARWSRISVAETTRMDYLFAFVILLSVLIWLTGHILNVEWLHSGVLTMGVIFASVYAFLRIRNSRSY